LQNAGSRDPTMDGLLGEQDAGGLTSSCPSAALYCPA